MPLAQTGIGAFQVFDAMSSGRISSSAATLDAHRYGIVWGSNVGMPPYWTAGNSSIITAYYLPQPADLSSTMWGAAGHTLSWWQANHPSWILDACLANGTPTHTPAYLGGLPGNVPLDFHNPAVVAYQIRAAAAYARAHGYNALSFDQTVFYNIGGANAGTGAYSCGVWQGSTFVRRYASKSDSTWATDVVAWARTAHSLLTTDATLAPYHLKLVVNHPVGYISNANEQSLLENVDADIDESGFSDYGNYTTTSSLFKVVVDWMRFAQSHGAAPLIVDKWPAAPTAKQMEYAMATYLIGNEGGAGLFSGNEYGVEQFHPEYTVNYGSRCASYYGGTSPSPNLWYRRYGNAFVVVNSGPTAETATLPSGHAYRDLEGRAITNPLSVAGHDAYVLLTTNGCS